MFSGMLTTETKKSPRTMQGRTGAVRDLHPRTSAARPQDALQDAPQDMPQAVRPWPQAPQTLSEFFDYMQVEDQAFYTRHGIVIYGRCGYVCCLQLATDGWHPSRYAIGSYAAAQPLQQPVRPVPISHGAAAELVRALIRDRAERIDMMCITQNVEA